MSSGYNLLRRQRHNTPSTMAGITAKLIPWTRMCNLQFATFSRSFPGDSCSPLTRKMNATAPYRMLYSERMTPPCRATALNRMLALVLTARGNYNLHGKKYPKTQAVAKPMIRYCASMRLSTFLNQSVAPLGGFCLSSIDILQSRRLSRHFWSFEISSVRLRTVPMVDYIPNAAASVTTWEVMVSFVKMPRVGS